MAKTSAPKRTKRTASKKAVSATRTKTKRKSLLGVFSRKPRITVVITVLALVVASLAYGMTTRQSSMGGDFEDGSELIRAMNCEAIGEEVNGGLSPECNDNTIAISDELTGTCEYELPAAQAASCPEQTATLGDTTTTPPMVWPIKKENWPAVKKDANGEIISPILNCDLLYTNQANKTISTGIEIAVPKGTPVYAAADGVVSFVQPGSGIAVIRTNLKNSKGQILYTAYLLLSERYVNTGDKVVKNQLIARSGSGAPTAEAKESLHFGVWTTTDFIGGRPTLTSDAGKNLLTKMEHPVNYLPISDRVISSCKDTRPYYLPNPGGTTPTPTPAKMAWPISRADWPSTKALPIAECGLLYRDGTVHTGIDISVYKRPVYAAANGTIVYTGPGAYIIKTDMKNPSGKTLYINYQHLSVVTYKKGSLVKKGQRIGTTGITNATAWHLHFSVWTTNAYLNGHMSPTSATGKARLAVMEHPMNYLPHDGRKINECKGMPYKVPDRR